MPRKRKASFVEKVEETKRKGIKKTQNQKTNTLHGPMYNIMSNVQLNESLHTKYLKEMQVLYTKMDHDAFMFTLIKMIKSAMEADENNTYAYMTLIFCSKYVSCYQGEETHSVLKDIFNWLLSTISSSPHIRFRLCQFVNLILNALGLEAALDDHICDSIMCYMMCRLKDMSTSVRVQAILALQRLQVPNNPDDDIMKAYQFHLNSDPSPKVRQAVISSMGRNYNTIPYIIERLWDIDEKVRKHTYINMSSYPVKSYKVSQRLTFLEQGLNDRSEMVRKVVTTVMLPQWLESYNQDYLNFISALKLDATEEEMKRFRKITKYTLKEMFKRGNIDDLIECLPIENNEDEEFFRCVPLDKLSIETSIYWLCLIDYLQCDMIDEIDLIIPDLSTFCAYILKYCSSQKFGGEEDKWRKLEYQYIILTLIEIVYTFDLGDEIGREKLKQLLENLLKNYELVSESVEMIVKCMENLIITVEDRLQFFVDIIKNISDCNASKTNEFLNDRVLIEELLVKHPNKDLKLKLSSLKVKILDLEEQETNFVEKKDYVSAQKIADEKAICNEEYMNLLKPLLKQNTGSNEFDNQNLSISLQQPKNVTTDDILKCLQIAFHMVVSKNVHSLTPNVCELYKDFIRRNIESNQTDVRIWALKCGTAYSMLYDQLAKDVYDELHSQFFRNQCINIWNTCIECIFELLDRYGFDKFENEAKQNKSKKPGRQLYKTLELLDIDDETSFSTSSKEVGVVFMMSHILDTCDATSIARAITTGLCRLVLHGHIKNDDILEKLLLKYFNPVTESEINQILGVFFENLIQRKKQEYLQPCLLPTISTILNAPYDSPLHEIKPETILRFVIDATRPQFCSAGLNIHNTIALSFMQEIKNNIANKDLAKILSKELITLEVTATDDFPLRNDLKNCCDQLLECELDPKTFSNITHFKDVLDGKCQNFSRSTTSKLGQNFSDVSDHEEHILEEDLQHNNSNSQSIQENRKTIDENPETILEESETVENFDDTLKDEQSQNSISQLSLQKSVTEENTTLKSIHTTFGQDNTTHVRFLRKSLNARKISNSDGPTRPNKIRIEARMQANIKGIEEVRAENDDAPSVQIQNPVQRMLNLSQDCSPLRNSSIRSPNKEFSFSISENDNSVIDSSKSDSPEKTIDESACSEVVPPSPQAIKLKPRTAVKKFNNETEISEIVPDRSKISVQTRTSQRLSRKSTTPRHEVIINSTPKEAKTIGNKSQQNKSKSVAITPTSQVKETRKRLQKQLNDSNSSSDADRTALKSPTTEKRSQRLTKAKENNSPTKLSRNEKIKHIDKQIKITEQSQNSVIESIPNQKTPVSTPKKNSDQKDSQTSSALRKKFVKETTTTVTPNKKPTAIRVVGRPKKVDHPSKIPLKSTLITRQMTPEQKKSDRVTRKSDANTSKQFERNPSLTKITRNLAVKLTKIPISVKDKSAPTTTSTIRSSARNQNRSVTTTKNRSPIKPKVNSKQTNIR